LRIENANFNIGQGVSSNTETSIKPVAAKAIKTAESTDKKAPVEADEFEKKMKDSGEASSDEELLNKSIDQANKSLATFDRVIERTVHEVTHTIMYTIRDTKTNEIICEFPPKRIQDMVAKMWEMVGLFVDGRG